MKNINVKKVVAGAAALALGVGVLGVAIAGNNNGTTFGTVAQSDVYTTSSMTPKVSIVTGTIGDDDAWAQNIANAIASNAKRENPDYASWVPSDGTTTSEMDDGLLIDDIAIEIDGGSIAPIELDDGDYAKLHDEDLEGEYHDDDLDINEKETLTVDGTMGFMADKDSESFMFLIESEGINYTADFSEDGGIPVKFSTRDDLSIYFMGQLYDVQKVESDGAKITLVGSGGTQAYTTGSSMNVTGTDGEEYTLVVGNAYGSSGDDLSINLSLMQGDTKKKSQMFEEDDTIEFDGYELDESISVVKVYDDTSTVNEDIVELSVGSGGLLVLEDGEALPGYENDDEDKLWSVGITYDKNNITKISVYNDEKVWDNEDLTEDDDLGLVPGDEIELPLGFGSIKFLEDLTEETLGTLTVGGNEVTWEDRKLREHTAQIFYEDVQEETITIDGKNDYYFVTDGIDVNIMENDEDGTLVDTIQTLGTVELEGANDTTLDYTAVIYDEDKIALVLDTADIDFADGKATWAIVGAEAVIYDYNSEDTDSGVYIDEEGVAYATLTITENSVDTNFFIDVATGNLVNTALDEDDVDDYNFWSASAPRGQADYNAGTKTLNSEDAEDDLGMLYTPFGSYIEVDGDTGKFIAPEGQRYLQVAVGGVVTTSTGGTEENPYDEYIMTPVTVSDLLKKDSMAATGTLIVVGGHLANTVADGITNDSLAQEGQWIMGKHSNGNIYVAGWTKADTGTAAGELVTTINGW